MIDKLPKIIAAQTAVADTLVRWSESGYKSYKPGKFQVTVASAMNINDPVSFPRIKSLIDKFEIHFYRSSEQQILKTWGQFTQAGANICPQGAVAINGIMQAKSENIIKRTDVVVSISTASAIKFSEAGIKFHKSGNKKDFANPYLKVAGSLEALEKTL